jgi:serine/threonine-protein kinase
MYRAALRSETPTGTHGESVDARFLQDRLRLFSGILALITAAFYVVGVVLGGLGIQPPFSRVAHAALWAMFLLMGVTWLYCGGAVRSGNALRAMDTLLMAALGGLVLVAPAGSIPDIDVRRMVMVLEVVLVVFTRSIFIPCSARRTLAMSTVTAVPLAVTLFVTPMLYSVWMLMWLLAAISVATAGSAVIYGLRREVRQARQLGQYTLEEQLGEGGMGVVYRARHAMLVRPTAVKLLRPERIGEASLQRFEREVQLTAGLSHPNTISVFDYGRTADGVFYYAMEYLDGLNLDEIVAGDGPQPPARVVHVVRQILGALGEAHGIGLVHRDVKPGNVIVCERGGIPDIAKVLDFGLVKESRGEPGAGDDTLAGTPHFLAPETIRDGDAGPRSDLYAVGAVAYYLLCGRHVFEGKSVAEICGHHLHTKPTPPSQRFGQPLPASLEAWVLGCLEKDPDQRPRSASDAAARLDACALDGAWTVPAARAWWAGRGRAIAAARNGNVAPNAATLSRSILERA